MDNTKSEKITLTIGSKMKEIPFSSSPSPSLLPDINDASHPSRKKAIRILESIADRMGTPDMFDCRDGDTLWYQLEELITNIIEGNE